MTSAAAFSVALAESRSGVREPARWPPCAIGPTGTQVTPVTFLSHGSPALATAYRKLARISVLSANWDSYGADPPNARAVGMARAVLRVLSETETEPTSIDPSVEGGVCLSFTSNGKYADIECFNNGEILAVVSKNGQETRVWQVKANGIREAVEVIDSFVFG